MRRLLLVVVAVVAGAALTFPYLGLDRADSRIPMPDQVHYAVLVAHIFAATIALVLGPLQFLPRVRARRRVHRAIGRTYLLAGVLPAALTAIPVALWSGNPLTQISLTVAALLWLLTGALAYRSARRRDFAAHRAWMMRNYALTFLAVTARLFVPLLLIAQLPFGPIDRTAISGLIPIGQTAAWIVNLLVVELLLRRRRTTRSVAPATGKVAG